MSQIIANGIMIEYDQFGGPQYPESLEERTAIARHRYESLVPEFIDIAQAHCERVRHAK